PAGGGCRANDGPVRQRRALGRVRGNAEGTGCRGPSDSFNLADSPDRCHRQSDDVTLAASGGQVRPPEIRLPGAPPGEELVELEEAPDHAGLGEGCRYLRAAFD